MVKALSWYLLSTLFRPYILSDFPLLLHDCTDLKSVLIDFVCIKGLPFTKKKYSAIYTFWWCLAMGGGKGTLGIFLWWYGLILVSLPCIMGICGTYMGSAQLVSSMVIGKFLNLFSPCVLFTCSCCCSSYKLFEYSCWIHYFDFTSVELWLDAL